MLPMLSHDKANHALYGYTAFVIGSLASFLAGVPPLVGGAGLATLVAVGKEAYDRFSGTGIADRMDIVATVGGAIPVAILMWALLPG